MRSCAVVRPSRTPRAERGSDLKIALEQFIIDSLL